MPIDSDRLIADFLSRTPEELLDSYAKEDRDFRGTNLLRSYIEPLAEKVDARLYSPPPQGLQYGYWRDTVSPLWVDRTIRSIGPEFYEGSPVFHWDDGGFTCLLENDWELQEEDPREVEVTDLARSDLANINLQGAYLYRVNLAGASLQGVKLQRAVLIDVDLSGAELQDADFREAIADGTNFSGADLTACRFERASLAGCDFSGANLYRARLRRANLYATIWKNAVLRRTRFSRNNLIGADLRGLSLEGVRLQDAIVSGSLILPEQEGSLLDALSVSRDPDAPYRRYE